MVVGAPVVDSVLFPICGCAIQDIASVIRNPEISGIVGSILGALANPTEATKTALDTLSTTSFVHSIDAPSLALIVPVLRRGLHDRATAVKVSSCLIIGNICTLVGDPKVGPRLC